MGVNKNEGNYFYVYAFENYRNFDKKPTIDDALFKSHIDNIFHFYPQYPLTSTEQIRNEIWKKYSNNGMDNFDNLDHAGGDFNFKCPQTKLAQIYRSQSESVFFYYFTELSDKFYWPEWLGVLHDNVIPFVFGAPLNTSKGYDEAPKVLAKKILKYWSNFVRFNDPNGEEATSGTIQTLKQSIEYWPRFNEKNAFLKLNSSQISIEYNLCAEYCSFWENLRIGKESVSFKKSKNNEDL